MHPFFKRKNLTMLTGLLLASLAGFWLTKTWLIPPHPQAQPAITLSSLSLELESMEKSYREMEAFAAHKDNELFYTTHLLEEKYDQLNAMELQIDQLESEGKINQSELKKLRDRLAYLQHKTLEEYKSQIDLLIVDNTRLTRALESADSLVQEVTAIANESESKLEVCQGIPPKKRFNFHLKK